MSRKKTLISGTIINTVASLYIALLNFIIMPILIDNLGIIEFGLIGIVNLFSMIGYISFFDFGMATSIPKFIAEYKSRNENTNLNELINTSLLLFIIIGIVLAVILIPIIKILTDSILDIPPDYMDTFIRVVSVLILSYVFQFPLSILKAILQGFMRFDLLNIILSIAETLRFIGIYLLITNGFSFDTVVYVNIVSALLLTIGYFFSLFFIFPDYKLFTISFQAIKKIRKLSSLLFIGKFSSLLYNNTDRLLIGIFLSPTIMASYEVLSKLPMIINKFLGLAVSTVIPVTSSINKENESHLIKNLYHRGFRLYFSFIAPIILVSIYFAKDFILLWVGEEFIHLHHLLILMLVWSLLTPLLFGGNILTGLDSGMKELTLFRFIQSFLKVISGFLIIQFFDLAAIPYSFLISSISILYAINIFQRKIKFDYKLFLKDIFSILLSGILPFILYYYLFQQYVAHNLFELGLFMMVWCIIQWSLIYFITFDPEDKLTIKQIVKRKKS